MRTPTRFLLAAAASLAVVGLGAAWQSFARHHQHASPGTARSLPAHGAVTPSAPRPNGSALAR